MTCEKCKCVRGDTAETMCECYMAGKQAGLDAMFKEEEKRHQELASVLGSRAGKQEKRLLNNIVQLEKENVRLREALEEITQTRSTSRIQDLAKKALGKETIK